MGALDEIYDSVKTISARLEGCVVGVGHRSAPGSGFVISDGRVLTNAHNIRGEEVTVTFADGRNSSGSVSGMDPDGDLAVIAVETSDARPLDWADPAACAVGLPVFGTANPGGQGVRVTVGFVSSVQRSFRGPRGRRIRGAIEHTAPLLPGSSGGPLVDTAGKVLAINTNRLGEGFYLAVPADEALRAGIQALSQGESPTRPHLGVGIAPAQVARAMRRAVGLPEADGLLIRYVEESSPADAAGLAEGDLIVEVGGRPVADVDELYEVLQAAGAELELKVLHGIEERRLKIELG